MAEDKHAIVHSFMEITGEANEETAMNILASCDYAMDSAIDLYFSGAFNSMDMNPGSSNSSGSKKPQGQSGSGKGKKKSKISTFVFEVLDDSNKIYKIVEEDAFGQYPFMYIIDCAKKVIVIDTGCGGGPISSSGIELESITTISSTIPVNDNETNDLFEYICFKLGERGSSSVRTKGFLVICTHSHFDHIGGNFRFIGSNKKLLGFCMGSKNPTYSMNFEVSSLCCSHGTHIKPFTVNYWLDEGDVIDLDSDDAGIIKKQQSSSAAASAIAPANTLAVLYTPGHTLDSISLLHSNTKRLFCGDLLYPYTAVSVASLGSNTSDFLATLKRLLADSESGKINILSVSACN